MHPPLRFLHASDLHLERPPRGLAEVPEAVRDVLAEAPYRAGQRVFDTAIKENVDFVLLAGDVVDPLAAGPRSLAFLEEQFSRLASADIKVYWAGGPADAFQRFAEAWPLSENVVRFPLGRVARVVHERRGAPMAEILGRSTSDRGRIRAAEFRGQNSGLFTLAVAHGRAGGKTLAAPNIHYWALGGRHRRRGVAAGRGTAHYPGSPQGRRPQDVGPHGCTLVEVEHPQHVRTSFMATDAVRYFHETLQVEPATTTEAVFQQLTARTAELANDPFGPALLIRWTIAGDAALDRALRHGTLAADLAGRLRAAHAQGRPPVWTVSIEPDRADLPGDWYEEQTLRGEFLRAVRNHAIGDDPLPLDAFVPAAAPLSELGRAAGDESRRRMRVLADVAQLGAELLGGEQPHSWEGRR